MRKEKIVIAVSAHIGTKKENIGDLLSAKAIAMLLHAKRAKIYYLPRDNGLSSNQDVIYGGGGMIRSLFSKKIYEDFALRSPSNKYYIYGVGLNEDNLAPRFSKKDILLLKKWAGGAQSITVRDIKSQEVVRNILKRDCKIAPCPTYNVLKVLRTKDIKKKYYLGITVGFGHTKTYRKYRKDFFNLIKKLIGKIGSDKISLICHDQQDFDLAEKYFSHERINICRPKSFREVKLEYLKCKNILSLRGHGVIFAAACNLPCSIIPLNKKLNSLYQYHYDNNKKFKIIFKPKFHLQQLEKAILPKNIKSKFKL